MKSTLTYLLQRFSADHKVQQQILSTFPTLQLEENVQFKGDLSNLKLGEDCIIQRNTILHLGGMAWCDNAGKIEIGKAACISPNVVMYGTGQGGIVIGDYFDCGPGACITSSKTSIDNVEEHDFASVKIGNRVTLYANVVISPGVTIGDNVVVGANSVITEDVPAHVLVVGNPAVVVKKNVRQ